MGANEVEHGAVPPALVIRGLKKSFGASQALRGVDLTIGPAEVHALVGQNGSGKSTLVKVLAGYHAPDQGEATAHGEPLHLGDSAAAAAHDIRFVHQDLGLVDTLDAVENVALGPGFDTRMGRIRWRHEVAITQDAVRNLGYQFDVRRPVGELSPSERVGVAIARALRGWDHAGGRGLLVLDEPTASMPAPEVARLFEVIRGVRSSGTSILYVSHRFEEVFALADNVTVLRDGLVVISRPMAGLDHDQLVELLLGRRLTLEHHQPAAAPGGAALLEVQGVAAEVLEGFDLSVQPKEVVGVAGVTGSGREELAQLLFGLKQPSHGEIRLDGRPVRFRSPSDAIAAGIALVPGDRRQGLLPDAPVRENVTLVDLKPFCSGGVIQRRKEVDEVKDWIRRFDVTPGDPELDVLALSGGNQQKVVVAKWLRTKPRVLVLEEPTQGVDVGSKADIHEHLHSAAAAGVAVVVVSTDLEELVHLCDRVVVVVSGRTSAELTGPMLTSENLAQEVLASTARREAMHP